MSQHIQLRAPGSTANLGPGFDCFGLGLARYVTARNFGDGEPEGPESIIRQAYEAAGGKGQVWFSHNLEPGRGLGFSAAARSVGAGMALIEKGDNLESAKSKVFQIVADLEGHGDNAAGSVYGGLNIATRQSCRQVNVELPQEFLIWIASKSSSTDSSRKKLPDEVSLEDAVVNIESTARLVSCFYEGDLEGLRSCREKIHQDPRLDCCPESQTVFSAAHDIDGLHMAWLSGAGPSIGLLGTKEFYSQMSATEFDGGKFFILSPDTDGLALVDED